jgi:hypothetical protein
VRTARPSDDERSAQRDHALTRLCARSQSFDFVGVPFGTRLTKEPAEGGSFWRQPIYPKLQFGTGFSKLYHFKNKFPGTPALASAVYPAAKFEVTEVGVVLKPSPPPVSPRMIAVR